MSKEFENLSGKNKKINLFDFEGCAATGQIICAKGDFQCENCDYAKEFLRKGHKVDINAIKHENNHKNTEDLLKECEERINYSKKLINEINCLLDKNNDCKSSLLQSNLSRYKWVKNDNYYSKINNKNIHLSKAEKDRIRQEHILKYNTPKKSYIYNGNEIIETDLATYVHIKWNDGTTTKCRCQFDDQFNYGYGVLICCAKKFVKKLNINLLESILFHNKAAIIIILETFILNTAGTKCLRDIRKEAKSV